MITIRANFEADGTAHLRNLLRQEWGAEAGKISDEDIPVYYFDSLRRRLPTKRRSLQLATDFRCASEDKPGWQVLQQKIRKGQDLNPHRSRRHASLCNRDGLLDDWGVHHFHLGTASGPISPGYVKRTRSLVLGLLDDRTFYAIGIVPHGSGTMPPWADVEIVESIHRNWPDMINRYRVNGVTGRQLTAEERTKYRENPVNTIIQVRVGTTYSPLTGGVSSAGVNMETNKKADRWRIEIRWLQAEVERMLPEMLPIFAQHGYQGELEVKAELNITESSYQIYYPKYQVLSTVKFRT